VNSKGMLARLACRDAYTPCPWLVGSGPRDLGRARDRCERLRRVSGGLRQLLCRPGSMTAPKPSLRLISVIALLASSATPSYATCREAVATYNEAREEVSDTLRRYASCVSDSGGRMIAPRSLAD
jgi:hypothetical protein